MQQSVQKRARQQLSCTACRHGKLRCNRQQPCDQCFKRSKASSCQYLTPPEKKSKRAKNTKDRIAHLEGLVVQLMNQNSSRSSSSPGSLNERDRRQNSSSHSPLDASAVTSTDGTINQPPHSDLSDTATVTAGQLKVANGETSYHGSAHWEAILQDIAGIKAGLDDEEEDHSEEDVHHNLHTPLLVLGAPSIVSKEFLIQSVPSKPIVDRFLWHWFNSPDPTLPIIHKQTFIAEYDKFWENQAETPTIWLAILFSIMCLGCRIAAIQDSWVKQDGSDRLTTSPEQFQELASCALVLADYTKPRKYTVEALMLYAGCEYMRQDDSQTHLWLFMAVVLRTALRMGYHRDSDHYPYITPFEGEMRRRVWYCAYTFDILTSFQHGLPGMVLNIESDTQCPRNLPDTDFDSESTVLPPSRPLTEITAVTYMVVKSKLVAVFAKASTISHAIQEPSYSEVMVIDEQLQQVLADFPPPLRFTSMSQSITDSPSVIFNRLKLELLYQKTRCVLHRRYLTEKPLDPRMELSRRTCVEAAMELLKHHASVFEASQGTGPLSSTRWFMSSLNAHDFLLAAMILCLELNLIERSSSTLADSSGLDVKKVDEIKRRLRRSYEIYQLPVRHFARTGKALKVMELMLAKTGNLQNPDVAFQLNEIETNAMSENLDSGLTQPLGFLSIDPVASHTVLPPANSTFYEPIGGMFDVSQGLDWQSWDKFINQGSQNAPDFAVNEIDPHLFDMTLDPSLALNNHGSWI